LRKAWDSGDRNSVVRFWGEQKTGPMVEAIPNDPGYSLVTFFWKAKDSTRNVAVITALHSVRYAEGEMDRLGESDLWYRTYRLRNDARLGYLFVESDNVDDWSRLDRRDWEKLEAAMRPDPLNPMQFGTKTDAGYRESILELPNAPSRAWAERNPSVAAGKLADSKFKSAILNNERDITVYTPPGYAKTGPRCSLLILFDRDRYNSKEHVEAPVILDNLLAAKKIPPTIAVLVGNVDRNKELGCHAPFADFLANELVPWVRGEYGVAKDPSRVIVAGSSFGGLAASYAAFKHPEVFGNVLSQSGSYWWEAGEEDEDEWLTRQFVAGQTVPVRFYLEVGLYETWIPRQHAPTQVSANRHFRDVLRAKGYSVQYSEFSGAHDYLNWRCTLPRGLVALASPGAQNSK
jgi:enterochelin esterase family protein